MLKIHRSLTVVAQKYHYKSSGELTHGEVILKNYLEMSDMVKGLILWKRMTTELKQISYSIEIQKSQ